MLHTKHRPSSNCVHTGRISMSKAKRSGVSDMAQSDTLAGRGHSNQSQQPVPHFRPAHTHLSRAASWASFHSPYHIGYSPPQHLIPITHSASLNNMTPKQVSPSLIMAPQRLVRGPDAPGTKHATGKSRHMPSILKHSHSHILIEKQQEPSCSQRFRQPHCDDDVPLAVLALRQGFPTNKSPASSPTPCPQRRSSAPHSTPRSNSTRSMSCKENNDRHSRHIPRSPLGSHHMQTHSETKLRRHSAKQTPNSDRAQSNIPKVEEKMVENGKTGLLFRVKRWFEMRRSAK